MHAGGADATLKLWSTKVEGVEDGPAAAAQKRAPLQSYPTKATPVFAVRFSRRNLLMASGALTLRKR